jgi:hypothetical protein
MLWMRMTVPRRNAWINQLSSKIPVFTDNQTISERHT